MNIQILQKYIDVISIEEDDKQELLYEISLHLLNNKKSIKELIYFLDKGTLGYNHPRYEELRFQQEEEDRFATTPFEIEEGVLECERCGSKKTFSFQKQTRSADEGATTFAQCVECGNKWRYNN